MAQTMGQFAQRMRKYPPAIERGINKLVQKTALLANQVLVLSTPVDTGRARSNWLPSIGQPRREVTPPFVPYPQYTDPAKFSERANATAAINAARLTVASRTVGGGDIYFSNNVSYIADLNDGTSSQAPAAFVQMAVEAASAAARQNAGRLLEARL